MPQELPELPRPDLPTSHPADYLTIRTRVRRRKSLPDDGGLWINDAIQPDILESYNGTVISDTADLIAIEFASLHDAASWAEGITTAGHDREMLSFATPPARPFQPLTLFVNLTLKDPS